MKIDGMPAIVTGAGSGMGAATARHLASLGAKVAALDLNVDAAKTVAAEIGGVGIECDVSDDASASAAVNAAQEAHGIARVCVNCAGIAIGARVVGREGPHPLDLFKKVIDVNLNGSFNMIRLFAQSLSEAEPLDSIGERGVVVSTASVAGYEGQIGQAAYSASKGGVIALTLPIARELARFGIRVMTIAPGLIATPMLQGMSQEIQDSLAATVPFPARFGEPSEYAALVQHILENQMLNGEVIRFDGAIRLQPK